MAGMSALANKSSQKLEESFAKVIIITRLLMQDKNRTSTHSLAKIETQGRTFHAVKVSYYSKQRAYLERISLLSQACPMLTQKSRSTSVEKYSVQFHFACLHSMSFLSPCLLNGLMRSWDQPCLNILSAVSLSYYL